jgi:predicted RNA-binding protein YlqC (UPF0109 family)
LKETLELIIKSLVDDVEAVSIEELETEGGLTLKVKVASTDMGRIIGKQGRMAKAIRDVIRAIGIKEKKKVTIEFVN